MVNQVLHSNLPKSEPIRLHASEIVALMSEHADNICVEYANMKNPEIGFTNSGVLFGAIDRLGSMANALRSVLAREPDVTDDRAAQISGDGNVVALFGNDAQWPGGDDASTG